jgi:hypothetical protein
MNIMEDKERKMEKSSTHKCEIIPISLEPCPGSDFLSIVRPFGGYTVLVRTEDWKDKKLGAYVVPDSLVNTCRDEFAFLKTDAKYNEDSLIPGDFARIRAKKMRGMMFLIFLELGDMSPAFSKRPEVEKWDF